jgi:hypothetical protein
MQRMTEAAVRDSEAMKQISYLTMVFLPASFVAVRSSRLESDEYLIIYSPIGRFRHERCRD